MAVTRWVLGTYTFIRNPDRRDGDTGWIYPAKATQVEILGANSSNLQIDGVQGAIRTLQFTGLPGTMKRTLENLYLSQAQLTGCKDHLYSTTASFSCMITSFSAKYMPSLWDEDVYTVSMTLLKM